MYVRARHSRFSPRKATEAGQNATDIRARGIGVETKPDASPVTITDKEKERLIREAIEREFPPTASSLRKDRAKPVQRPPLDYRPQRWYPRLRPRQPILVRPGRARRSQRDARRRGAFSHAERDVLGNARQRLVFEQRPPARFCHRINRRLFVQSQWSAPYRGPPPSAPSYGTNAAFVGRAVVWRRARCLPGCGGKGGDLVRTQSRGLGPGRAEADHRRGGRRVFCA